MKIVKKDTVKPTRQKNQSDFQLENFDVFQRPQVEHRIQTVTGGAISIIALFIMTWLFLSEFSIYLNAKLDPILYVDATIDEKLKINLDITFHSLPCGFISVNALDKTGNHQLNVHHDLTTRRLDLTGKVIHDKGEKEYVGRDDQSVVVDLGNPIIFECGSCYGAESENTKCCNTCEDVQKAYNIKGWAFNEPHRIVQCVQEGFTDKLKSQKNEGCLVTGYLTVSRVSGNLNIVPGKLILQNSQYVVDSEIYKIDKIFNLSHTINHISFGDEFPGIINPLDGTTKIWQSDKGSAMYEYFTKIVPTVYEYSWWRKIKTNQFSVSDYEQTVVDLGTGVPGFFLMYEFSPITVEYQESSRSFLHFLVNICAIIGGVYTVASMIDSFIYHTLQWRK